MPSHIAARRLFQTGLIGLGAVGVASGDFLPGMQPVPASIPGRALLALGSGVVLIAAAAGLEVPALARTAGRILFGYLVLWVLLLVPAAATDPLTEVHWRSLGEIRLLAIAGWLLLRGGGEGSARVARTLAGLSLLPIGLSHFVYARISAGFVPAWAPAPAFFVWLGGAGHLAAGLGILFGIVPRLAALMEAGMLMAFALLVWIPRIVAAPDSTRNWSGFWVTWAISAAMWVLAESYREAGEKR